MKCQCWFIDCNKCITVVEHVVSEGDYTYVESQVFGNHPIFLLNFAVNLKLL